VDAAKAKAVVDEIKEAGGDAIAVAGDITADDFPANCVGATVKQYGKINHIVNNGTSSARSRNDY
jgi:3-oxoacyl-[acyl-carrier protein] reductase